MQDRSRISHEYHDAERRGTLDSRDPVDIAGDEGKYVDLEVANMRAKAANTATSSESGGLREGLKKRIGSLKKK